MFGNKFFEEVAKNKVTIEVTSDLNKIKSSDKAVLPGQGSFKSCLDALDKIKGLQILNEFAINYKNLLRICVGLQMFADVGYEETETRLRMDFRKVSKLDNRTVSINSHIGWIKSILSKIVKFLKI